jgi:hypothetical protein
MDVVGHQTIAPDRRMFAALLAQQIAINFMIGDGEKLGLAAAPAMGHMVDGEVQQPLSFANR